MKTLFVLADAVGNYIFEDLSRCPRTILLKEYYDIPAGFFSFCYRYHTSMRLNRILPLPGRVVCYQNMNRMLPCLRGKDVEWVVFTNFSVRFLTPAYLLKLKKQYGFRTALLFFDTMDKEESAYAADFMKKFPFDLLFSYDRHDAVQYGMQYVNYIYSAYPASEEVSPGVYFAGTDKGRYDKLTKIWEYLRDKGVPTDFTINEIPAEKQIKGEGLRYNRILPYPELVKQTTSKSCILEYLQEGQEGDSLRAYEAVCYGRKLLTNHPGIRDFPFYRPEYMRVFSSPEEIDTEWIMEDTVVDYGYHGEFSPVHLLEMLRKHG